MLSALVNRFRSETRYVGLKSALVRGKRRQELLRNGSPSVPAGWKGMLLEGDPGTNPLDRPRHLENVRFQGGNLEHRGNLVPVMSAALQSTSACVKDLYDFQTNKPRRAYIVFSGCPGLTATTGFTICWLDFDQKPPLQRGAYYPLVVNTLVIGSFDGKILMGMDTALRSLTMIVTTYGSESLGVAGSTQDRPLDVYAGFTISAIGNFDGKAFLGLAAGAGASKIGTWDGLTSRDDVTGIDPPTAFCVWRDKLVVGFALGTGHIRTRPVGDSPGTWTTVAAVGVAAKKMVSYRDILYIADGAANIWSYDGTTLAIVHTIVGAKITGLAEFNTYLYFSYQSATNHAIIGRMKAGAWTDVHNDMNAFDSSLVWARSISSYRGCLVALVQAGTDPRVYVSQDQSTTLGFTEFDPSDGVNGGSTQVLDVVVM